MNIGINNVNNRPNFGMAVLFDETALPVMKKQAMKLSQKGYEKFWANIDGAVDRQMGNRTNIIVRKANHRDALVAEIVDENADTAIKNYVTAQGLIHRNGSLKFLDRAESKANKISDSNSRIQRLDLAEERHYYPGATAPEEEIIEL